MTKCELIKALEPFSDYIRVLTPDLLELSVVHKILPSGEGVILLVDTDPHGKDAHIIVTAAHSEGHVTYECSRCGGTWEFDYHTEQADTPMYPTFDEWNRVNLSELEAEHTQHCSGV